MHVKRIRPIHRRTLLRGVAGAGLALPWLELMGERPANAGGGGAPRHFIVAYGGISLGRYEERITPSATGTDYEPTTGLRPLFGNSLADGNEGDYDYPSVTDEFSVVSGLQMPWDGGGPASRGDSWHGCTMCPQLCGISISGKDSPLQAPSSDWLVQQAIAEDRTHLKYRVQVTDYQGNPNGNRGRLSAGLDENGELVNYVPTSSPKQAYLDLFANIQPGDGQFDLEAWERAHARRLSVVDLVRESSDRLRGRLGAADRQRLERHFDEIRALEGRLKDLAPPGKGTEACSDPGEPDEIAEGSDWSNETLRADLMAELTYQAIACDQASAINLQITYTSCYMSAQEICGENTDVHETGHSGDGGENMGLVYAWHIKPLARLVDRLRSTPGPLGTLLDQTALVFVNEAGMATAETEEGDTETTSHSSSNMLALVAGRAGGHIPGRHMAMSNQVHPSSAIVSAMRMVGCNDPLGELDEDIPELLV